MRNELENLIVAARDYIRYQSIGNAAKLNNAIETAEHVLKQPNVIGDICNCEARTFYEWEKEENTCSQCGRTLT